MEPYAIRLGSGMFSFSDMPYDRALKFPDTYVLLTLYLLISSFHDLSMYTLSMVSTKLKGNRPNKLPNYQLLGNTLTHPINLPSMNLHTIQFNIFFCSNRANKLTFLAFESH